MNVDDDARWNFIPAKAFSWGALWFWMDDYT